MQQIKLGNTNIQASQIGFGCVALTMHASHDKAIEILQMALSLGITHFDVARAYGSGEAETILGKFAKGKRDRITITTKFGIIPSKALANSPGLKNVARRLARRFSFVRRLAGSIAAKSGAKENAFGPQDAAASLETSLRELQTDYVDIFTLHEATVADARRDDLIEYLNRQVQAGRIRAWGISSQIDKLGLDGDAYPDDCRFLQFDHNTLHPNLGRIAHIGTRGTGIFAVLQPMRMLSQIATDRPELVRKHSQTVGVDLSNPSTLISLLLNDAIAANNRGVTLISTTRAEHLAANIAQAECNAYSAEQLQRFGEYVREAGVIALS